MKIDLSIIVLSYNTKDITLSCLSSIVQHTRGLSYEIIVVDNASNDGSSDAIEEFSHSRPQVTLIRSAENLGFGRGNNLGAKRAKGEYLLFLNSDTRLTDNALNESYEFVISKPDLGVYSCRLLNEDKSIQPSGGHFPTLPRLLAWQFFLDDLPFIGDKFVSIHPHESGFIFLDRFFKSKKRDVVLSESDKHPDWVTGAFMVIPKKVFKEVGGFDEKIFMYTEEMELAYRICRLGYKTYFRKSPSIIHLGGASGGSYLALSSEVKNMIYFWRKHMPAWQLPIVKMVFFIGSLLRFIIFGIIKGDETYRKAYARALRYSL